MNYNDFLRSPSTKSNYSYDNSVSTSYYSPNRHSKSYQHNVNFTQNPQQNISKRWTTNQWQNQRPPNANLLSPSSASRFRRGPRTPPDPPPDSNPDLKISSNYGHKMPRRNSGHNREHGYRENYYQQKQELYNQSMHHAGNNFPTHCNQQFKPYDCMNNSLNFDTQSVSLNTTVQQYMLQVMTSHSQTSISSSVDSTNMPPTHYPPPPLPTTPPSPHYPPPLPSTPPLPPYLTPPSLPHTPKSTPGANDAASAVSLHIPKKENANNRKNDRSNPSMSQAKSKLNKKSCTLQEVQMALRVEQELLKKGPRLYLRFPDPPLNIEIVKEFNSGIQSVHFQQSSAPRFCFVDLNENADVEKTIEEISKIPFGMGFIRAELKHNNDCTKSNDIDPLTLHVSNLPCKPVKLLKQYFPQAVDIDIHFKQRQKTERSAYAFVRYANVDDAIVAFRQLFNAEIEGRSLVLKFLRRGSPAKKSETENCVVLNGNKPADMISNKNAKHGNGDSTASNSETTNEVMSRLENEKNQHSNEYLDNVVTPIRNSRGRNNENTDTEMIHRETENIETSNSMTHETDNIRIITTSTTCSSLSKDNIKTDPDDKISNEELLRIDMLRREHKTNIKAENELQDDLDFFRLSTNHQLEQTQSTSLQNQILNTETEAEATLGNEDFDLNLIKTLRTSKAGARGSTGSNNLVEVTSAKRAKLNDATQNADFELPTLSQPQLDSFVDKANIKQEANQDSNILSIEPEENAKTNANDNNITKSSVNIQNMPENQLDSNVSSRCQTLTKTDQTKDNLRTNITRQTPNIESFNTQVTALPEDDLVPLNISLGERQIANSEFITIKTEPDTGNVFFLSHDRNSSSKDIRNLAMSEISQNCQQKLNSINRQPLEKSSTNAISTRNQCSSDDEDVIIITDNLAASTNNTMPITMNQCDTAHSSLSIKREIVAEQIEAADQHVKLDRLFELLNSDSDSNESCSQEKFDLLLGSLNSDSNSEDL